MRQVYAFENKEEYEKYQDIIHRFGKKLNAYQKILEDHYSLTELPKGILWTSEELATKVFSDIPIPAYTNKDLIYMSPDLETWRKILVRQLDGKALPNVQKFYESYSENQVFIILAHELTHHSDLFLDEFDDEREDSIWFEEGMCFYLPRKILLSEKEFNEITNAEAELFEAFKNKYGNHSLDNFGSSSYLGSLSSIMFDYWRSYLSIKYLVEVRANNNVKEVFDTYHRWHKEGRKVPLTEYFKLEPLLN
ncbi:hypothetical protein OR571_15650 [Psychrobacillus sp. NEAU-3TGS]|uniref:hypothetical protein n=1 Tax=Psychrobacillus sp. NEAU-3TGS TaxID=2995412 RepID=UPI002496065F|nr:hypothetical protein [Psychrobacillus sp. NEAU-3TGS]MDI2588508.1 hypothetical protein [Psychrobacillus sp. NEAU-3TGS]